VHILQRINCTATLTTSSRIPINSVPKGGSPTQNLRSTTPCVRSILIGTRKLRGSKVWGARDIDGEQHSFQVFRPVICGRV
jgi:hypothetical protein